MQVVDICRILIGNFEVSHLRRRDSNLKLFDYKPLNVSRIGSKVVQNAQSSKKSDQFKYLTIYSFDQDH